MQYIEKLAGDKKLMYAWFLAMFTRVDIILVSDIARNDLKSITEKIKIEIEKLEAIANRFDDKSEISKVNNTAFHTLYAISSELFEIIDECLTYTALTLGYFDITVNSKNAFTGGSSSVFLDKTAQGIRFLHADVQLDLSGFVKGYVLRNIRNILIEANITDALINIGNSSILAMGNHPHGEGWKVSTFNTVSPIENVLHNQCFTTSGNNEKTIWPILKPQTHETVAPKSALSVITDDPAIGEVLSKALYVASDDERKLILNNFDEKISWMV